jgi:hypothetical protein
MVITMFATSFCTCSEVFWFVLCAVQDDDDNFIVVRESDILAALS